MQRERRDVLFGPDLARQEDRGVRPRGSLQRSERGEPSGRAARESILELGPREADSRLLGFGATEAAIGGRGMELGDAGSRDGPPEEVVRAGGDAAVHFGAIDQRVNDPARSVLPGPAEELGSPGRVESGDDDVGLKTEERLLGLARLGEDPDRAARRREPLPQSVAGGGVGVEYEDLHTGPGILHRGRRLSGAPDRSRGPARGRRSSSSRPRS